MDETVSGATTPGLCIPQSSSATGASPSDCLVSYPKHMLEKSYPSAEMESVYSADLAEWSNKIWFD